MNILIVDDNLENRYLLESLLKGNSHDVISVENGKKGLEALQSEKIDLIISDILMPVMDGFDFCRTVKSDETLRHIPLIIYTATYTGPKDESFALKIGADRFIIKPCEPEKLMEAIDEVMKSSVDRNTKPVGKPREEEILKLYNERLVRKLEHKMLQLEEEVQARRETEKRLIDRENRYKSILDNIEDGYYEVDLKGNLTFFNRGLSDIIGYSESELMDLNYQAFTDKENSQKVFQAFNRVFTTGDPSRSHDWELIRKDGSKCYINNAVSLIRDSNGQPIGFRGILRDVSEHRKAEKDKLRLKEQLQQAQKMEAIGTLAGGIAHDFNNLLSIILGYGEIVLGAIGPDPTLREKVGRILQAGDRARDLTRQLLAYSRKQVLEVKVIDVNTVVTGFEKFLRRLIGEDISLDLLLTPLPLTVKADITQLEQVLMNLAVNARHAMPDGGTLTIRTALVDLDAAFAAMKPDVKPGNYAMVEVCDTGCGMGKDSLARIFDPFFTTKGKDQGTGLGLATSYGIIKQHGGNIWVYSEPDQGAIFKVFLPICETQVQQEPIPRLVPEFSDDLNGNETVLLVEDNEQVRFLAKTILQDYGYSVLSAQDGESAIAILDDHHSSLDLLLTDMIMPGMNGKELYEKISARYPGIKSLFMSGYADDVIADRGMLDDKVNFIQKPFSVKTLATKVRNVLEQESL